MHHQTLGSNRWAARPVAAAGLIRSRASSRSRCVSGVEAFYSAPDPAYSGTLDVISLYHVLKHVPEPVSFLKGSAGDQTTVVLSCSSPRIPGKILLTSSLRITALISTQTACHMPSTKQGWPSNYFLPACFRKSWLLFWHRATGPARRSPSIPAGSSSPS
jgi:hypothetical protein